MPTTETPNTIDDATELLESLLRSRDELDETIGKATRHLDSLLRARDLNAAN